jgi:hypothetical protein
MKLSVTICILSAFTLIQSASAQSATCSDQTVYANFIFLFLFCLQY